MCNRLHTMSRFEEPANEERPLQKCYICDTELFRGDSVLKNEGCYFCSEDCFIEFMGMSFFTLERGR